MFTALSYSLSMNFSASTIKIFQMIDIDSV